MESEKKTERYLCEEIEKLGGFCIKQEKPRGFPDRLIIMPNGKHYFVELKSEGKQLFPLQIRWAQKLRKLGHNVYTLTVKAEVNWFLKIIKSDQGGAHEGSFRVYRSTEEYPQ